MLDTCGQGPPYKLSAAKVIPLNMAFNTIFISSSWVDVNSISHMTTADVTAWDDHFKPIVLLDLATRGRDQLAAKPTIIPEVPRPFTQADVTDVWLCGVDTLHHQTILAFLRLH